MSATWLFPKGRGRKRFYIPVKWPSVRRARYFFLTSWIEKYWSSTGKRDRLMRMLENPNLSEHASFTDLLWAVTHLTEELSYRENDLLRLPESDYRNLAGDLKRAYFQLTGQWLQYTLHLKENYPYLFSLAARINPMNPAASPYCAIERRVKFFPCISFFPMIKWPLFF